MKRKLLYAFALLPFAAMAQHKNMRPQIAPEANAPVQIRKQVLADIIPASSGPVVQFAAKKAPFGIDAVQVGKTFYDLQSNSSVARRVIVHAGGKVSVTWITTPDGAAGFLQRGSGYNHFDGTNWGTVSGNRVENARTGWPSIGVLPGNIEYLIGHDAENGGFKISKNTGLGSNTWTTGPGVLKYPNNQRPIWNRAANDGNTIHVIANFSDSTAPGDPRVISLNGVAGPMVYSRSKDGGVTWDIANSLLPDYDSTRIVSGGGDQYALDVKGNHVAIVFGGLGDDVALWRSTDGGDNFTKIIVDSFKYAPFRGDVLALDTPFTNDGTMSVLIDNNDKVHVFWGLSRILDDDATDSAFSFFPGTNGIVHWSEITQTSQVIGGIVDENANGTIDIERGTSTALVDGQIPATVINVARTGNTSVTTMPSSGIDANGRIFVTYSAPRELDLSPDNVNYRDVYIVFSTDDGATWSDPQNITQNQLFEDAFPSMARTVDNFVHVVWQQDDIPGTNLQNNATGGNNHPVVENKILYSAIPVSEILTQQIGNGPGVGIHNLDFKASEVFVVNQNYPNPFTGSTLITYALTAPAKVQLTVTNMLGQEVMATTIGAVNNGTHEVMIEAGNLKAGIYHYTLSTDTHSVTRKMIVR